MINQNLDEVLGDLASELRKKKVELQKVQALKELLRAHEQPPDEMLLELPKRGAKCRLDISSPHTREILFGLLRRQEAILDEEWRDLADQVDLSHA